MDQSNPYFKTVEMNQDIPSEAGSNSETNSEAESISEEERVRRLFAVCDADGDGFIDSHDLVSAIQELGLEGTIDVSDLMHQMGADSTQGKVSYQQFLHCRLSHKTEIDALRIQTVRPQNQEGWANSNDLCEGSYGTDGGHLPPSSEHSLGVASGKHESWEFDSGARDLSPEPNNLFKLIEAAGISPLGGHPAQVLDVANKLHLAALGSLRNEISELHGRLQRAAHDRDTLEQALAKTQLERLRLVQESEERLERQSNQYEERLTELHSVIAELTRKLNRQQYNVIKEEEEVEDEEIDEEEEVKSAIEEMAADGTDTSCKMSGNHNINNMEESDGKLSSVAADAADADRVGYSRLEGQEETGDEAPLDSTSSSGSSSDLSFGPTSSDEESPAVVNQRDRREQSGEDDLDAQAVRAGENLEQFLTESKKGKIPKDPLNALTNENKELKMRERRSNQEAAHVRVEMERLKKERDELKRLLAEANCSSNSSNNNNNNSLLPRPLPLSAASLGALSSYRGSPVHQARMAAVSGKGSRVSSPVVVVEEGPVCKVAERVRIKRLDGRESANSKLLTGSQIAILGVRDARVAEQLVSSVHQDSVQGEAASQSSGSEAVRVAELELEVERLASRSEHLRAQNDVLSLTLAESRAMGERLAVLLGKYESNCMALRLALERADRVSEAFEVLAALVESEMSLLLANCQVAGLGLPGRVLESPADRILEPTGIGGGSGKDWSVLWKRANERRRSAENLARSLLTRYDRDRDHWEDSGRHTNTTSSTSSGAESGSGSGSNPAGTLEPTERKVRDIIIRLKGDRASLENTIQLVTLPLESALVDPLPKDVLPLSEARKMDLEMAVIMQELMAMREERSRLRTQVYILEKERILQEAQHQTNAVRELHNPISGDAVVESCPAPDGGGGLDSGQVLNSSWALKEKQLQLRIQDLATTLERVVQNAELRSTQSAELVSDVKKANATLVQLLERTKKKYATRLRRLEQQMVNMSERHAMQVRVLKQRVIGLEEETCARPLPLSSAPSETSL